MCTRLILIRLGFVAAAAFGSTVLDDSSRSSDESSPAYLPPPPPAPDRGRKLRAREGGGGGASASRANRLPDPKSVVPRARAPLEGERPADAIDARRAPPRGAATCAEKMERLAGAIASDEENWSLRPLSIATDSGERFRLRGLDSDLVRRAYLVNRIAMLGDSTLQNLYTWLAFLLGMARESHPSVSSLETMTLSEANDAVVKFGGCSQNEKNRALNCLGNPLPRHVTDLDGGHSVMYARTNLGWTFDGKDVLEYLRDFKPSVLVANVGLHMLHMENYGRDVNAVEEWLEYEDELETLAGAAREAGARLLLLKTSNFVCGGKYVGDYAKGYRHYSKHDDATLSGCFRSYRVINPAAITDEEIKSYCSDAVLDEDGARKLNERLFRFVNGVGERHHPLKIEIFGDHPLQSCRTTTLGDGRHHHLVNMARIRLLANLIDCMNPQ